MSESPLDVVGIGSMVVDRLHRCPRLLGPAEKGILHPLTSGAGFECRVGGLVLNHLGWAAVLGLRAGIFGKQAADEAGRFLRGGMDRLGIERHLVLDGSSSSSAEIFIDDAGERAIYMSPGATAETTASHIRTHHAEFIRRGRRLTTEVSQLPLAAAYEALCVAREAGIPTLVDLDILPSDAIPGLGGSALLERVLTGADLLKPTQAAARELHPESGADALALAAVLRDRYGASVVMTDGEAGCVISAPGFEGALPAYTPKEVVDTTGAGDAFLGGLLAGLHHGLAIDDAARLGNACGAACVEHLGAFPDDPRSARSRVLELYDGPRLVLGELADPTQRGAGGDALESFDVALTELAALRGRLDPDAFTRATALILEATLRGARVHVTGVGKPEHVARYGASLLSSTGTPATFLHATEAVHGSAGQVVSGDVVIAISDSGETAELRRAVETIRALGARVVGVVGARDSWLGREADVCLEAGVVRQGGGLGFAPRASVAAELLVVAALSAALESASGLTRDAYHARHPAGALGAKSGSR